VLSVLLFSVCLRVVQGFPICPGIAKNMMSSIGGGEDWADGGVTLCNGKTQNKVHFWAHDGGP